MKKDNNHLQSLDNLLPNYARNRGWEEPLDLHSIFTNWDELVDDEVAAHCQPLKIVKKVLWVEVENSAWLQQLQYQTVVLLAIFNKSLRLSKLKGLRFVLAERNEHKKVKKEPSLRYVQPPAEELAAFEAQVASISDKDARDALVRFWYLSKACRSE